MNKMTKKCKDEKYKLVVKETYIISKGDKKLLELVKVAKEIVFKEDEVLFKELAKY